MIKSISAYYLSTPFVSPLTGATSTEYTVRIYVWSGLKTAVPAIADYEFTKKNLTASIGTDKINIARILNDFIEFNPNVNVTTGIISANNQKWTKTEVFYTTANPSDDGVAQLETTLLLVKGYGYGNEGENPQIPANFIHIPSTIYKVTRTTLFGIPIKVDETTSIGGTIISRPDREIDIIFDEGISTDSDEAVKLINVNLADTTTDETVEVEFNGVTIILQITAECRYIPVDIYFINKEGAQGTLTFFKSRTDTLEVTRETYEADRGQPSAGNHQYVDFNVQGKTRFRVNSGFVSEENNEDFRQLILSETVFMFVDSAFVPINILKRNLEYMTRAKDRLINYEFEFGFSFNEINNV